MKKLIQTNVLILLMVFALNFSANADPQLLVTPNPYTFESTYIGQTASAMFLFENTGDEAVVVTDITFTNSAFSIQYTAFTIGPGESGELPINFTPTEAIFYEGTMQIFSNNPVNPYEVQLSGAGIIETIDGWQWIQTGFDFILMDVEFPEGQNQIGYAVGQSLTYNGDGIIIKTTDSGLSWTQITPDGIPGLEEMSFVDVQTGYAAGWDGYVIKTTDGGATWDTLTVSNNMWEITDIEFYDENNGIILEGANIFLTNDGGQTWTQGTGLTKAGYMVEYLDANTLVVVGNENSIYKSTDGGNSWILKSIGSSGELLLGVDFLGDYGIAVGDYGYIMKTENGGETWTSDQPAGDVVLHAPYIWDEDTAWVCGTPEIVLKTVNGASTWNSAYNGNFDKAFYRITFTDNYTGFICGSHGVILRKAGFDGPILEVEPNPVQFDDTYLNETSTVMVTFANTGNQTLNVSDITFTDPSFSIDYTTFTIEPGESGELPVYFTPATAGLIEGTMQIFSDNVTGDPYEVQLSGTGMIYLNEGWQWIQTPYDYILTDMEFPEGQNQTGYCVGQANTYNGEGIVIKTTDGGDTWEQMTPAGTPWLTGISFINLNTGFVCGMGGDILKTSDGGETWESITVNSNLFKIVDVEFRDEDHGVITTVDQGVYVTDDGGETWAIASGIDVAPKMLTYADDNTLFAVGVEDRIFKSTDGGHSWVLQYTTGTAGDILLGVYFLNSQYGMAAGDLGHVYKTTDGGNTWNMTIPAGDDLLHTPFIWDQDTAWIVGTPEYVYKSTDGGNSWTSAYNGNFERAFYRILFTDNYTGFICGSHGVVLRKEGYPPIPAINVSPVALDFGGINLGESATLPVTVSNTGFGDLVVNDIVSTNDAFSVDMTAFTLNPGESQTVTVTFSPDQQIPYFGQIKIMSNDPENSVSDINVTGTGVAGEINVSASQIEFDTTFIDETSMEILTISNQGQGTLSITDITSSNTAFTVNMTNFDLLPGMNMDVEVTFAPTEVMMYEGTLTIESNDPENPVYEVELSGYGDIGTGTDRFDLDNQVTVYPNPVSSNLYLKNVNSSDIIIYDILGNVKLSKKANSEIEKIDVSDFVPGIYLIKIIGRNGTVTKKVKVSR